MPKAPKHSSTSTSSSSRKNPTAFYAVHVGRSPGVYQSWSEVRAQVDGFPKARHQKFGSASAAEHFVRTGSAPSSSNTTTNAINTHKKNIKEPEASTTDASAPPSEPAGPTTLRVYCDGACSGNGRKDILTPAGSGVWWEPNPNCPVKTPSHLSCRLPGANQSNNRAELYAIYLVLKHDPDPNLKLEIYTDSQYSINCMRSLSTSPSFFFISETKTDIKQRGYNQGLTKWLSNWLRNDWKTSSGKPVENRDLIDSIRNQLFSRDQIHRNGVKLVYVKGHAGIHGNEEADRLACMGALKEPISQLVLS